jgi:hypothetical protein
MSFTGNWLVNMPDSKTKLVRDIQPGDIIISRDAINEIAQIKCVLKLRINKYTIMTCLNGLNGINSNHPIYIDNNNEWIFPETYTNATYGAIPEQYVYNFILDNGHTINMQGGFNFACLGHGINKSPIIQHPYFGTNRIIDDLKDHDDWIKGYITLDNWNYVRNANNTIIKLEF